jgi:uncharacterized membrane protein YdjX (TVP38/TMEM64 family)
MIESPKKSLLILITAAIIISGAIYITWRYDTFGWLQYLVNEKPPPALFVALMALLPCIGFPIVIFLVLAGVKFGLVGGVLVATITLPLHLLVSFFLGHSVLRPRLERLLKKQKYPLPEIPQTRVVPFLILFVGIPSLPYAVKNYLLGLADIPFRYYFGISLPLNLLLSVPVIGLGEAAAEINPWLLLLSAAILLSGYLVFVVLMKKLDG